MPNAVTLSLEERLEIDAICDAYESRLKAGEAPPLEEFLASHTGPFRQFLLQDLQKVEREYHLKVPQVVSAVAAPGNDNAATVAYAPSEPDVEAWPQIPGYEILEKLGEGGMAVVYKARESKPSRRLITVKMIKENLKTNLQAQRRFLVEAEAVAKLDHPGIVRLYMVGEYLGQNYLCLNYLENGSLAARLKNRSYTSEESATLMEQIALAVQHAHEYGVLHRDLKPGNILLDTRDRPHVADFGLARMIEGLNDLTVPGTVLGTCAYMAPEQATDARSVTTRADVYALGAILYELLTGRPPNPGRTRLEQLTWLTQDQPVVSPREFRPGIPVDLEHICQRCLERDPAQRYASAAELAADLRRFLNGEPIVRQSTGIVDWIVQLYRTKTGPAEGSYIRSTIAYGAIRMSLHLMIAVAVEWGSQLWGVLLLLGLDFLTQGVILGAMLKRQFRQTCMADRYSIVVGSGSLFAQVVLILTHVSLHPLGSSSEILAFYPPMLVVGGLCGFILGATSWGVLFPLGLLTMLLALPATWWPISGPILYGLICGIAMVYWALAKAREAGRHPSTV